MSSSWWSKCANAVVSTETTEFTYSSWKEGGSCLDAARHRTEWQQRESGCPKQSGCLARWIRNAECSLFASAHAERRDLLKKCWGKTNPSEHCGVESSDRIYHEELLHHTVRERLEIYVWEGASASKWPLEGSAITTRKTNRETLIHLIKSLTW